MSTSPTQAIRPDAISWTTHHIYLCLDQTDAVLSSATAFVYERAGVPYLITNWHNVAGRSPLDGKCLSETAAIPDLICTYFRLQDSPGRTAKQLLKLYQDGSPIWLEHPTHRKSVDVVAIRIPTDVKQRHKLFPINAIEFDTQFESRVSDDAYVIGYPFFDLTQYMLPIWKRASIASEPAVNQDNLPKFYIDTATRSGLSGSPVVMRRAGLHGLTGGSMTGQEIIGQIQSFLGVYSGRIGDDQLKAQLGVVWKARVIDEIIDGQTLGSVV